MLKSKIHRVTVTEADKDYHGSLSLDVTLMKTANCIPFERISVYNVTNGNRFDTYLIESEPGSGTVCVNGAAAHLAEPGDKLIIASYTWLTNDECKSHHPVIVFVDPENKIMETNRDL
jgi:aspartate 1-decarboxylase